MILAALTALVGLVQASDVYIKINDLTGDYQEIVQIYQNNNLSMRYSQEENMSDITKIGGNISYDIVLTPAHIEYQPEGRYFTAIWVQQIFKYVILALAIGVVLAIISHMVKKR